MSLICGLNELYFDFPIHVISTNLARFKEAVAAGTGGDMLDSSAEFSEGLTVRSTTTGLRLTASFTLIFRSVYISRVSLDCFVIHTIFNVRFRWRLSIDNLSSLF